MHADDDVVWAIGDRPVDAVDIKIDQGVGIVASGRHLRTDRRVAQQGDGKGKNIMYFEDGREKETDETPGHVPWREAGPPHELLNISDWQYRNVLVEIKTEPDGGQ